VLMLMDLLPAVNREFGLTPEQIEQLAPELKSFLYGVIKTAGTSIVGRTVTRQLVLGALKKISGRVAATQVLKFIPLAGQVAAAAISGFGMLYVGNAHVDECFEVTKKTLEFQPAAVEKKKTTKKAAKKAAKKSVKKAAKKVSIKKAAPKRRRPAE
jgi:uncharacterized protein (DUF697 family)